MGALWLSGVTIRGQEVAPGEINLVDCPPASNVFLDGNWIGTAGPDQIFHISGLAPGSYQLRISIPGRSDQRRTVTIHAGQVFQLSMKAEAVAVHSSPPDRQIVPASATAPSRSPEPQTSTASNLAAAAAEPGRLVSRRTPPAKSRPVPPPIENAWGIPLVETLGIILLAAVLVLAVGGLIRRRAGRRSPVDPSAGGQEAAGSATIPSEAIEPTGEPEFLERLRFKEALVRDGFRTPKEIRDRDMVLDIDSYEVGKDL